MKEEMDLVAKTFQGLEDVLAEELKQLGATDVKPGRRMVAFRGDKEMLYKANFCCRSALRILKPIYTFKACDTDELYEAVKKYDWEQLLAADDTFAIDSVVNSDGFRHSKFVTYRVKDAIADFFNEKYGKRPSIRLINADVQLNVHILNDQVTISLDSSGESLHKRGYRVEQTEAPINEVLAAGLILKTGWKGECNFIDPMCGSGTFLIEAALIACNINPGVFRQSFAFERWRDFDQELFDKIYNDDSQEREFHYKIYGSDISPKAIAVAARNIKSAGVGKYIDLQVLPFQRYTEAPEKGILVTNPPYGERISADDMDALYDSIGERLKHVFRGYKAWIIGYKSEYFDKIGLKPTSKTPILNGGLECEFREYDIFDGTYAEFRKHNRELGLMTKHERPVRWKNQGDKFGKPEFKKKEREEKGRGRRFDHREKPKNALEEKYRKPYSERMRDNKPKEKEEAGVFADKKVNKAVQFRQPRLYGDMPQGEVVMRHRRKKEEDGDNSTNE